MPKKAHSLLPSKRIQNYTSRHTNIQRSCQAQISNVTFHSPPDAYKAVIRLQPSMSSGLVLLNVAPTILHAWIYPYQLIAWAMGGKIPYLNARRLLPA
mmetsp:Transcript_567/g.562  ORF Transcript_567/g.562 Transcript_567/m.562 type:complete len:98 (-) Transcript_567:54-347(-)